MDSKIYIGDCSRNSRRPPWDINGTVYGDCIDADGRMVEFIPKPARQAREPQPEKPKKPRERVGRFYLVKHTGWYGLIRVDGTGAELWCPNKKAATAKAWNITTREGEAERRAGK